MASSLALTHDWTFVDIEKQSKLTRRTCFACQCHSMPCHHAMANPQLLQQAARSVEEGIYKIQRDLHPGAYIRPSIRLSMFPARPSRLLPPFDRDHRACNAAGSIAQSVNQSVTRNNPQTYIQTDRQTGITLTQRE